MGDKKIWFTEFGYCSNSTPPPGYEYCTSIDATTQANFLVQAFQMARNLDYVAGMMQWNLNYQLAVPQTDEKWGFGIIRDDWSPRPAYNALAANAQVVALLLQSCWRDDRHICRHANVVKG